MKDSGKISFFAAVLMSVNIMVGAGIYYAVGPLAQTAGTVSFFGWPLIGLLLFPVIWGIAKTAGLFPGEGGFYHYCSSGINPTAGFTAHWGYLIGFIASAASLATVLRNGLAQNAGINLIGEYPILFNLGAVIFYSLIQLLPLSKISKIQSIATLIKISPLFIVIGLTVFYFNPNLHFEMSRLSSLSLMIPTVIFGFWGFEACCSIGGYLKGGPQKVPSVILIGFFATTALYLLFHFGLLHIMGAENLAAFGAVGFPKFLGLSPIWEAALQAGILGAILFCWANSILGMSLGNISNIYVLAKRGMIFGDRPLSKLNRNERPTMVVFVHGVFIFLLLTFITDLEILFSLSNLGILLAFFLTLLSAFNTYLKQQKILNALFIGVGFLSCAILGYYSWTKLPNIYYTLPLIGWMAIGIIQFKIRQRRVDKLVVLNKNS
ncbi:MAG: APC family permease [Parachlamydiales bacterium]|nr:APC family permease [Parachlamydiales bacterium]